MSLKKEQLLPFLYKNLKVERKEYKNERFKELSIYDFMEDGELDNLIPHLRPLEDLYNIITHDGETFIPIYKLCDIEREHIYWTEDGGKEIVECPYFKNNKVVSHNLYEDTMFFGFDIEEKYFYGILQALQADDNLDGRLNSFSTNIICQRELWDKLYEWHFDVDGLIEKKLAKIKK